MCDGGGAGTTLTISRATPSSRIVRSDGVSVVTGSPLAVAALTMMVRWRTSRCASMVAVARAAVPRRAARIKPNGRMWGLCHGSIPAGFRS
jgi:hypothetical protein